MSVASELFPPPLHRMLQTGLVKGRTRELNLVGASTENNLLTLANLLRQHKTQHTLEGGLACGASALVFTHAHRMVGHDAKRVHVAVDTFQADLDDTALVQIESDQLDPYFEFIREPSYAALPRQLREGQKLDIIYIDGSHHFDHVDIEIFYSSRLLGGIVRYDDSTWPEVKKVIKVVRRNWNHALREIDLRGYREDGGNNLKYRLGKVTRRLQLTAFQKFRDPQWAVTAVLKSF